MRRNFLAKIKVAAFERADGVEGCAGHAASLWLPVIDGNGFLK